MKYLNAGFPSQASLMLSYAEAPSLLGSFPLKSVWFLGTSSIPALAIAFSKQALFFMAGSDGVLNLLKTNFVWYSYCFQIPNLFYNINMYNWGGTSKEYEYFDHPLFKIVVSEAISLHKVSFETIHHHHNRKLFHMELKR